MKKILILSVLATTLAFAQKKVTPAPSVAATDTIVLAGGCYWCVEAVYENLKGVQKVVSGFAGGTVKNPSYEAVSSGNTGAAEVIQITFNKNETSLDEIFKVFFTVHDPTTLNRQGADVGTQYRSAIFYKNEGQKKAGQQILLALTKAKAFDDPIVTTLEPLTAFYPAKESHQNYYQKNNNQPYCRMVIQPKLEKFEKVFKNRLKTKN
ncbi:MAG: peptide-methionine (S)-S-oxide reductase MsrA [Flavobacterium sp.]